MALSPWIWGYDGEPGAITTDVTAGVAIVVLSAAGILFPSLLALNVLAGTWLMIAPWLVGYGSHDGPVGLSDTVAGTDRDHRLTQHAVRLCPPHPARRAPGSRPIQAPGMTCGLRSAAPPRRTHGPVSTGLRALRTASVTIDSGTP